MLSLFQDIFLLVGGVQTRDRMTDAIYMFYKNTSCLCMCKQSQVWQNAKRCLTDGACEEDRSSQADKAVNAVVMSMCKSATPVLQGNSHW